MAAADLSGFNGSVTLPTTHGGDARGFTMNRAMTSKEVSRYGGDRGARFRGGMITISGQINIFLRKGAAATSPGIVTGSTVPAPDGAALVLTFEVGCTLTGTALFEGLDVNHQFTDPAIEGTHTYKFTGLPTEVWAVV
jgi:hypothetical protein